MIVYSIDEDSIDPYMESFSILLFESEEDAKIEKERLEKVNKGITYSVIEWDVLPKGWRHKPKELSELKMLEKDKFMTLNEFMKNWVK